MTAMPTLAAVLSEAAMFGAHGYAPTDAIRKAIIKLVPGCAGLMDDAQEAYIRADSGAVHWTSGATVLAIAAQAARTTEEA